ncbi:MAG: translocation/assembly module TamB domain-containing protein [Bacteroidota bacterium]
MRLFLKIFGGLFLFILVLLVGTSIYLQTESGQIFFTKRVNGYLKKKIETPFKIQKIKYSLPDWIELEGVYFADKHGDTLVAGQKLYVNMDMLGLLQNRVHVNELGLEKIQLNINRRLPDTTFNFEYILNAFKKKDSINILPDTTQGKGLSYNIDKIKLQNVSIDYLDDQEGIDAKVQIKNTNTSLTAFDPSLSKYHFDQLNIEDAAIDLRLYSGVPKKNKLAKSDTLDVAFNELKAKNIHWKFADENAGLINTVKLGQLKAVGNKLYLESKKVHLKTFELSNTVAELSVLRKKTSLKKAIAKAETIENNWAVLVDKIILSKNTVQYDNQNEAKKAKGIDFNNLKINELNLNAERLSYSDKGISGWIYSGSFKEKAGLQLKSLQTDFAYTEKQTFLKKLELKTPQSIIRDEFILSYASLDELSKNLGNASIQSSLKNSQIGFKDLLLLFPEYAKTTPFEGNENGIVKINGKLSGKINNLQIATTTLTGFDGAKLSFQGQIKGLPNPKKTILNLNVTTLAITQKDLLKMLPKNTLPNTIELPQKITLNGKIAGKLEDLSLNTNLQSDFGNATFNGKLINITAEKNQKYEGKIILAGFEMGKFLKKTDQFGKLTLNAKVKGTGFDIQTLETAFDGIIEQAEINGYNYKNASLKGTLSNQIFTLVGNISDPNLNLVIDSQFDISKEYPSIKGKATIDQLNLKALGFYTDNIGIKGDIDIDMQETNPENPTGTITINKGTLTQNGKVTKVENMTLTANNTANGKSITINAPFIKAKLNGNFNYLQIPDIFILTANRYFVLPDVTYKPVIEPYSLTMDLKLVNHPALQSFFPLLTRLDTTRLIAKIDSKADTLLRGNLSMPFMEYDTIKISNAKLSMVADQNKLKYSGGFDGINYDDFQVRKTSLEGIIADNSAGFKAIFRDFENKNRNELVGTIQSIDRQYRLKLANKGLLINYLPWVADSTGYLQYGNRGLLANNFNIKRGEQKLIINSTTDLPNGPINVTTDSLEIQNFVSLFSADSTLASGKMDGQILLSDYMTQPSFKGDMVVKNFNFKQKPIGNLTLNIFNESANKITTNATLVNQNNDLLLTGSYFLNTKNNLNLNLIINKLSAETVEAFSMGEMKRAKGNLNGKAEINGSFDNPEINGNLNFDKVAFDLSSFGGRYLIDKQTLLFEGSTIRLNQLAITDTLNQPMKVNGTVLLTNIPYVKYDLTIDTKNFLALNSTRKDNDLIYGKGIVDADLTLKGVSTKVKIDGDVKIRENSSISIIIANSGDDLGESEGVVVFVNRSNPEMEVASKDTLVEKPFVNDFISEISLNIEADEKSELTIIVDEINGDNLKVKGHGKLNAGINNNGKPYMLGSYDLTEGSYGLTFEVLKKQFSIQKGSSIIWSGDPMNGEVDITAIYKVNTSPLDLMENEIANNRDVYRQKMNFEVQLTMTGKLSRPNITFKIVPSESQRLVANDVITNVKTRLNALNAEGENKNGDEINKQVFALLVLNRFFSDKSSDFFSSNTGGSNASAFARQSVSKLLSDQLNQFASSVIKGVDLDVNLSSSQDYFNGVSSTRTDLNLGLSKAFFNDKVEIKVGRNFELENNTKITRNPSEVFDNLMLNYKLSSDGKFLFKAFRKNQYQSVLEGFIVETGVGFSISRDYRQLGELFMRRKKQLQ